MKITMGAVPFPMGRFSMKVRDPGRVRVVSFELKEQLLMVGGKPRFDEQPVMFIEAAVDGPIRDRTFVGLKHGEAFEPDDDELAEWRASGISGGGTVVHLFEIRKVIDA
jgi:hypothetical protein